MATMQFCLNGEDMGEAVSHVYVPSGLMPAASLTFGEP